eukprot:g12832.t1
MSDPEDALRDLAAASASGDEPIELDEIQPAPSRPESPATPPHKRPDAPPTIEQDPSEMSANALAQLSGTESVAYDPGESSTARRRRKMHKPDVGMIGIRTAAIPVLITMGLVMLALGVWGIMVKGGNESLPMAEQSNAQQLAIIGMTTSRSSHAGKRFREKTKAMASGPAPPQSEFDEVVFPALVSGGRANTLAVVAQLLLSQWWSADELRTWQLRQAEQLARHAIALPHIRDAAETAGWSPDTPLTEAHWARWPVLSRDQARALGETLFIDPPKTHGKFFYEAIGLREFHWSQRDPTQAYALIKHVPSIDASYPDGFSQETWGGTVSTLYPTGPTRVLDIRTPIDRAADWLSRVKPGYLNTFPSMVDGLIDAFEDAGLAPPPLIAIRTQGEVVSGTLRQKVRDAWGVPIVDCYSAEEAGYLAHQSPIDEGHLLVCAETSLVEVLDEDNRPCAPGEVGRVVVTALQNFAMPLIRYAIGDYAEAGSPSACGRGLPVIQRVLGRSRARLVLPDGTRRFAYNPSGVFTDIEPVRQYQVVQAKPDRLTVRLVASRELNQEEANRITAGLEASFGFPFAIDLDYVEQIERSAVGKFEDIRSEL